jgi:putative effector of murein hydrolase
MTLGITRLGEQRQHVVARRRLERHRCRPEHAMGIAEAIDSIPTLTVVLVILRGIIGAIAVTPMMNALGLKDYAARGFAAGVASHGIGTARAFQVNELAGTFAGLGLALNGLVTAVLAPLLIGLWR